VPVTDGVVARPDVALGRDILLKMLTVDVLRDGQGRRIEGQGREMLVLDSGDLLAPVVEKADLDANCLSRGQDQRVRDLVAGDEERRGVGMVPLLRRRFVAGTGGQGERE
jgi:hypothetical protein